MKIRPSQGWSSLHAIRYAGGMEQIQLDNGLMPEARWNTHLSCLAALSKAASRGHDIVDVAGLTGLAFRTCATSRVTPVGLYLSWAWEPSFTRWLSFLGLDADVVTNHVELSGYGRWLDRQYDRIDETLSLGLPVMHWDNTGFGLILGKSGEDYLLSGVPGFTIHPNWVEQDLYVEFTDRAIPERWEDEPHPVAVTREALTCIIEPEACFIHPRGTCFFDAEDSAYQSIYRAHLELNSIIEFPRHRDDMQNIYEPQFGTQAYKRWRSDLKDGRIHLFGLVQTLQALGESRRLAVSYLKRLPDRVDAAWHGRLEQVTHFYERIVTHLRKALTIYSVPIDHDEQMTRAAWETCRDALYQVEQTEKTAGRLLSSIVHEVFE